MTTLAHRYKDIQRLRKKPKLLKYANENFEFGKYSPLRKKYRRLVVSHGDGWMAGAC